MSQAIDNNDIQHSTPIPGDIHVTGIVRSTPAILSILLKDRTLCQAAGNDDDGEGSTNITYASDGHPYDRHSHILPAHFADKDSCTIMPRVSKHKSLQLSRSKCHAEVFTPAWICNAQNNLVDEQWFGRRGVFNTPYTDSDGTHRWETSREPVTFNGKKTWRHYLRSRRMEFTCGEAPYLASRYDTTTGERICIGQRIGVLDRKFRVINENIPSTPTWRNKRQWLRKAYQALQSVYGFDWQGDNVFLSRETLFHSFCDYYLERWHRLPHMSAMLKAAEIISWNIWQMDGITFNRPFTSTPAVIKEWRGIEPLKGKTLKFSDLLKKRRNPDRNRQHPITKETGQDN